MIQSNNIPRVSAPLKKAKVQNWDAPEGYCVFIGEEAAISSLAEMHEQIRVFDYSQGIKLVPYTSKLHSALCEEYGDNPPGGFLEGSNSLCIAMSSLINEASLKGQIIWVRLFCGEVN